MTTAKGDPVNILSLPDVSLIGVAIAVILVLVAGYIVLSQLAGTKR